MNKKPYNSKLRGYTLNIHNLIPNIDKADFLKQKFKMILLVFSVFTFSLNAQNQYSAAASTGTYSALVGGTAFTWTESVANDEGYTSPTPIGFSFNYNGTAFTQFQASTNGFIRLGTGLAAATASDALNGTLRSIIAPLWEDLAVTNTTVDITYQLSGVTPNQVMTIEWNNMKWNKTATGLSQFQLKLYEVDNHIEFIYGTLNPSTSIAASIGLADNTVISTTGSATGKFLSLNIGGIATARTYHQSMGWAFSSVSSAPDANTVLTFTKVTPSPISAGTYTIGGVAPTYATLSEAAMALNLNGISGAVVLNIRSGTYDDVFHLIEVAGSSSANTITITKESGSVTLSPSNGSQSTSAPSASAGDAIFRFDGADFVTIDGLGLTQNVNNTTSAKKFNMGILVANSVLNGIPVSGAQNNTFKNLSINLGSGSITAGLTGIRLGTAGSATGITFDKTNSFNTIQDVNITGFHASGIKMFGHSAAMPDSGNVITAVVGRNTIGNVAASIGSDVRVIELDCESTVTIEKTDIVSVSNTVATTNAIYGIVTNLAGNANLNRGKFIIRDNTITGLSNGGAAVTTGISGGMSLGATNNGTEYEIYRNKLYNIFSNASTTGRSSGILINGSTVTNLVVKFYNNMISDIRAPRCTSGPAVRGFDLQNAGGNGIFSVYNNSVYLNDATPPTAANHQSASMYVANMGTGSVDFRNNILVNTMSTNGTGRAVGLYASANSNLLRLASTTNNNLYFIGTGSATRGISTDVANIYQTLATHQAAVATGGLGGPRDLLSQEINPQFHTLSNLHVLPTSPASNAGSDVTSIVATDIDGDTRTTTPDIGADEFVAATASASGSITSPTVSSYTAMFALINPGGVEINPTSYTSGASFTAQFYGSGRTGSIPAGVTSLSPYYWVISSDASSLDITLRFYFDQIGGNGVADPNTLRLFKRDGTGTAWTEITSGITRTATYIEVSGLTSLSEFVLGGNVDNPLPVELVSFTAQVKNRSAILSWETKTEIDNLGFEVERKDKSGSWMKTGFVEGHGTSNAPKYYNFEDKKITSGKYSYRLKQIDNNGSFEYSDEVEVTIDLPTEFAMSQNYPNPFNPSTKVDYQLAENARVTIELYGMTGERVEVLVSEEQEAGYYSMMIDAFKYQLTSGIYIYRMTATDAKGKNFVSTKKLSLIK